MTANDAFLRWLERWEVWKRVAETPDRVDELERMVSELHGRLAALGDGKLLCRECGSGPVTIETKKEPYGVEGVIQRIYRTCSVCGTIDRKDGAILVQPKLTFMSSGPADRQAGY